MDLENKLPNHSHSSSTFVGDGLATLWFIGPDCYSKQTISSPITLSVIKKGLVLLTYSPESDLGRSKRLNYKRTSRDHTGQLSLANDSPVAYRFLRSKQPYSALKWIL